MSKRWGTCKFSFASFSATAQKILCAHPFAALWLHFQKLQRALSAENDQLFAVGPATGFAFLIGKGNRSEEVVDAMKKYGVVYFAATGGAGALIAQRIRKCDLMSVSMLISAVRS